MAACRDSHGAAVTLCLQRVLIVPAMGKNLFSVRQFKQHGAHVQFGKAGDYLGLPDGRRVPLRTAQQFFVLDLQPVQPRGATSGAHALAAAADTGHLWHRRLCHRNDADLRRLAQLGVGISADIRGPGPCSVCELSKHTHHDFPRHRRQPHQRPSPARPHRPPGARRRVPCRQPVRRHLHRRPHPVPVDPVHAPQVRHIWAPSSSSSDDVRPHGSVKALRSDGGGEYTGAQFKVFCKTAGIAQQFSAPYAPQQNGIAERGMRTLAEMARCMLEDSDLSNTLWAEAMRTAVYVKNRTPSAPLGGDTPYSRFHGRQAKLTHLRVFGSRAFVQHEEHARRKLDSKAWEGVLVGYADDSPAYRILDTHTRKVHQSIHVTFWERPWQQPPQHPHRHPSAPVQHSASFSGGPRPSPSCSRGSSGGLCPPAPWCGGSCGGPVSTCPLSWPGSPPGGPRPGGPTQAFAGPRAHAS